MRILLLILLALPLAAPAVAVTEDAEYRGSCITIHGGIPPGVSITLANCVPDVSATSREVRELLEQILGPEVLA